VTATAAEFYVRTKTATFQSLSVFAMALAVGAGILAIRRAGLTFNAHKRLDRLVVTLLMGCSVVVVLITAAIVLSLLIQTVRFFDMVPPSALLDGMWNPASPFETQGGEQTGQYGIGGLLTGTVLISLIALGVATPLGLLVALYLSQYASRRTRQISRPFFEVLAGIPTVVYGFFAVVVVAPLLSRGGVTLGLDVAADSALAAGTVMGIMIMPYVSSLCDDAISAVPRPIRDGALALGATSAETVWSVVLPAALPGVLGALLLAFSRTIGETMIVLMAAGLASNLSFDPTQSVTTVTVQIVQALTGVQRFDTAKALSAFMLGMTLFMMTLTINVAALFLRRHFSAKAKV
ncbi:MAG: phosphate ABC transporter permease subunit PstC, partial [Pseudomonadota bacterium]